MIIKQQEQTMQKRQHSESEFTHSFPQVNYISGLRVSEWGHFRHSRGNPN